MKAFVLRVCFLLVLRVANGQLPVGFQEALHKGEGLEFDDDIDDNDEYVSVIVGYKTRAAMAKFGDMRVVSNVRQFERMNAVTMQIPVSELDSLHNDPDVASVEEGRGHHGAPLCRRSIMGNSGYSSRHFKHSAFKLG